MIVCAIDIAAIDVGDRLRALDPAWVDLLAEEMERDGQAAPIRVVKRGERYALIDGARRLAALDRLGKVTIAAVVEPEQALADAAFVRLGEIKGNLIHGDLTVLDRALYVAAWRDAYLLGQDVRKRGRPTDAARAERNRAKLANNSRKGIAAANDDAADPFVDSLREATRKALDISDRSLSRMLRIASIGVELARALTGHRVADIQAELLLLAGESEARREEIVALLTGGEGMASVTEAIWRIEGGLTVSQIKVHERLYNSFARWPKEEKREFYALIREDFEHWLAEQAQPARRKSRLRIVD